MKYKHSYIFVKSSTVMSIGLGQRRVDRTGGRTDASPPTTAVFFSSYKLPTTVTVTTFEKKVGKGKF